MNIKNQWNIEQNKKLNEHINKNKKSKTMNKFWHS